MIFPFIEDYIEFIAGYKDIRGNYLGTWNAPVIHLASYDVSFVQSVATQTLEKGVALSYKQASLVETLISKYDKQLSKLSVNQPNHKNYRKPLREVSHISSLTFEDDMIYLRFPFNNTRILAIKAFLPLSHGRCMWSKDKGAWIFAPTEFNVSWLVTYAQNEQIAIAKEVQELFDLIIEAEKTPYKIELNMNEDGKFYVENAPESMANYLNENIGFDNLLSLVDNAGVLGYTINKDIESTVKAEYGSTFIKLCADRNIDLVPNSKEKHSREDIVRWAIEVDRLPICVYNPNFLTADMSEYKKFFEEDEIKVITLKDNIDFSSLNDDKIKLIYSNRVIADWKGRMPLLVTYANLMHGSTKKEFLSKAEKVVYYCATLPR